MSSLTWGEIPYLCFDTETTGFRSTDRIVEIAFAVFLGGERLEGWSTLVNPGVSIPAEASAVHGIYDHNVAGAPSWEDVRDQAMGFLCRDTPWVAHSLNFDVRMISQECGDSMVRSDTTLCTLDYSKKVHPVLRRRNKGHKLSDLAEFFEVPFNESKAHGAAYDTDILGKVAYAMLKDVPVRATTPGFLW